MERIEMCIQKEDWGGAAEAFLAYAKDHAFSAELAIFGATIALHVGDDALAYQYITQGLKLQGKNYELYLLLGEYYASRNTNQMYLCYENAYFFCRQQVGEEHEDTRLIKEILASCKQNFEITVRPVSFVVLSWNTKNYTKACVESIQTYCYEDAYEIVLVDNGSTDGSVAYIQNLEGVKYLCNDENHGFAGGCNQGIALAEPDYDIFLLNSDAEMTENALFLMRLECYGDDHIGTVGATSNNIGNAQIIDEVIRTPEEGRIYAEKYNLPGALQTEDRVFLIGFAQLIRRRVLDEIGGLNEDYPIGNYEDNDLGMRILQKGYRNVLLHHVFVFHWGSKSFQQNQIDYGEILRKNREIFRKKWKVNPRDTVVKTDYVQMLEGESKQPFSLLQVECAFGGLLAQLQYAFPNATFHGTNSNRKMQEFPPVHPGVVAVENWGDLGNLEPGSYDYILMDHILEFAEHPRELVEHLKPYLKPHGTFLFGIYNAAHVKNIGILIGGGDVQALDGAFQKGVKQIFTLDKIEEFLEECGLHPNMVRYSWNPLELTSVEPYKRIFDALGKAGVMTPQLQYDAESYLVKAEL